LRINKINNSKIILDSIAEAVVTVDKDFKVTFINEAAERITGFKKSEILGQYCKHFFDSNFCEYNCPIVNVLKSEKNVYDRETEINCNGKGKIPIKLNAAILKDDSNQPIGGVISFRDISVLKELSGILNSETNYYGYVGKSKKILNIFKLIDEISDTDAPIVITGETGTGKEIIANVVQTVSKRRSKKYIKVNCSVIPLNLIISELFGHVKGAFTDAKFDRIGRFELADGGTIFLDEICDLPIEAQPKLLRFLQEGTFERLGESTTRNADVRVIAATNKNIESEIKKGRFREDLYYRLNVINIELPPLRERKDDLPLLINFFIKKYENIYNKKIKGIDAASLGILNEYSFPGNIRELENIIEYSVIRTKNEETICACLLPAKLRSKTKCKEKSEITDELHNNELIELLNKYKWNRNKVASILGIDRTTLWRRLKSIGLEK
jgi:PAS domain S-box-containing protein